MAATTKFGLSVIEKDPESEANFEIRLHHQPNLDSLDVPSTVRVLRVFGTNDLNSLEYAAILLKISELLHSAIEIHSIQFIHCHMVEIAQFVPLANSHSSRKQLHDKKHRLLAMEFQHCFIMLGAAISLQFLLRNGLLGKLGFMDCSFDDETGDIIADGLRSNQSLEKFALDWKHVKPPDSLIKGTYGMLSTNITIGSVGLNMTHQNLWDLHGAVESPLQCLEISRTSLAREDLGAIVMMCLTTKTLTSLYFWRCKFSPNGLSFLVDQLSKHVVLYQLCVFGCRRTQSASNTNNSPSNELTWKSLKTHRLLFTWHRRTNDDLKRINEQQQQQQQQEEERQCEETNA